MESQGSNLPKQISGELRLEINPEIRTLSNWFTKLKAY